MLRNPRFERVELKSKIHLTGRDRAILNVVEKHKFLRSSQIAELVGGSRQQILRRLQHLFHTGLLDRPRSQIDYYHRGGGSQEMIYSLPGRQVQRFYLQHALMTSAIGVAFERGCQLLDNARVFHEADLAGNIRPKLKNGDPFQWHVDITRQLRVGVRPDLVLQVASTNEIVSGIERATFFIEADRGTMPVTRGGLEQTSILRKLLAYHSTWAQGIHRSLFDIDRFRVLIVTSEDIRVEHMVDACRQLERGQRLFLFASHHDFVSSDNVFSIPLINGKGETDCLLNSRDLPVSLSSSPSDVFSW